MIKWSWKFGGKSEPVRQDKNISEDKKTSGGTYGRNGDDKKRV